MSRFRRLPLWVMIAAVVAAIAFLTPVPRPASAGAVRTRTPASWVVTRATRRKDTP